MSWRCLPELAAASLAGSSLDGAPSVPSKWSPTLKTCSLPANATDSLIRFLCGEISAPSTATHGTDTSMSSAEAFPVRTSALPDGAMGSTASEAGCGGKWLGSWAKYDPDSSLWRTHQFSLAGDLEPFSETWPRSGSMRHGECFLRPTAELHTSANASGLWPTPVASDTGSRNKRYAQGGTPLSLAVKLYPTPTAGNHKSGGYLGEWGGSRARERMREMVPSEEMFGPLNPEWVEWLMGWPAGWSGLEPLATVRYQEWQQQHSLSSPQILCEEAA